MSSFTTRLSSIVRGLRLFIRQWTLPVAMLIGSALYLLFAYTPQLDAAGDMLYPILNEAMPWCMFFILFVTFCKVNFHELRLSLWHLRVCVTQVLMVAVIVAIALLTHPTADSRVLLESMLTCIICPTATAATVITVKLDGDLNAMTAYTLLSNLIASVSIPLFLPLIEKATDLAFVEAFVIILRKVIIILVLPLLTAYVVRHYVRWLYIRVISVRDLAFYLWAASLAIVTGITVRNITHATISLPLLSYIAVASLIICLWQFFFGKFLGRRYNSSIDSGQALGQKNTVFAIWVATTYLNPLSALGPGFYILWQNIVNGWQLWRKTNRQQHQQAAA